MKTMKQQIFRLAAVLALFIGLSQAASAQIYVTVRPVAPVIVRPAAPSRAHVWIGEEWEGRNGAYAYVGGHWAAPPRPGLVWVPGHWRATRRRGDVWVAGHWR